MLVVDTAIIKPFLETLAVLEPSREGKVLAFVCELLKNCRMMERRIETLQLEIDSLNEELSKLDDVQNPVEQVEKSPYADDDDEEEGGD